MVQKISTISKNKHLFDEDVIGTEEDRDAYIVLGFVEEPKNRLLTKPEFTPSKIGG